VSADTVNALLAFGKPMITERDREVTFEVRNAVWFNREYRVWMRHRAGGRTFGRWDFSPQFAADALLAKLRARRC
jgi:hypothetical protein